MDKLTDYIIRYAEKEKTEWREITLEKVDRDSLLCWCVKSTNEYQPIDKILVRYASLGPISARIIPAVTVIDSEDSDQRWTISSVEFWGEQVDDVDVILKQTGCAYLLSKDQRFSKADFLNLWPHFKDQVTAAHEVTLIFRVALLQCLTTQVGIEDCVKC